MDADSKLTGFYNFLNIFFKAYDTSLRNDDSMEVRRLDANNAGNVTAVVSFSLKTFCDDSDFRHYPDDIYKCCFLLEPHFNQVFIFF